MEGLDALSARENPRASGSRGIRWDSDLGSRLPRILDSHPERRLILVGGSDENRPRESRRARGSGRLVKSAALGLRHAQREDDQAFLLDLRLARLLLRLRCFLGL